MRTIAFLFLGCWYFTTARGEDKSPRETDTYKENAANPKGMHLESRDTVTASEGNPVRVYYIVDAQGKKRSDMVEAALLPLKGSHPINFQWLQDQKYLVTFHNRHKFFEVSAYVRNANGHYEKVPATLEDGDARLETMRRTLAKSDPSLSPEKLGDLTGHGPEWVDEDTIQADKTGVNFTVETMGSASAQVFTYRFDCEKRRFVRLKPSADEVKKPKRDASSERKGDGKAGKSSRGHQP